MQQQGFQFNETNLERAGSNRAAGANYGLSCSYLFDENKRPTSNYIVHNPSNYMATNRSITAESATRALQMTQWCIHLGLPDTSAAANAAECLGRLAADEMTRGEVLSHLSSNPEALLHLTTMTVPSKGVNVGQWLALKTLSTLAQHMPENLLLIHKAVVESKRLVAAEATSDMIHLLAGENILDSQDTTVMSQSLQILCSFLGCSAEVWQLLHADVFTALFHALAAMARSQDKTVFTQGMKMLSHLLDRTRTCLESLLSRAPSGPAPCTALVVLLAACLAATRQPQGMTQEQQAEWRQSVDPLCDPAWRLLDHFARHPMGIRTLMKEDIQMQAYRRVPSFKMGVRRNEDYAEDVTVVLLLHLSAHLSTYRRAEALSILESLGAGSEGLLTLLSQHPHPGALLCSLCQLACLQSSSTNEITPSLKERAFALFKAFITAPPLFRQVAGEEFDPKLQEPLREVVSAVAVLFTDLGGRGKQGGLNEKELLALRELLSTLLRMSAHKPAEFVFEFIHLSIFTDVVEGLMSCIYCRDFQICETALKTLKCLADPGRLQAGLLHFHSSESGLVDGLVVALSDRLVHRQHGMSHEESLLMTQSMAVLASLLSGSDGAYILTQVLGDFKETSQVEVLSNQMWSDFKWVFGFSSSSSSAPTTSSNVSASESPQVLSHKATPADTLMRALLNMLADIDTNNVDISLAILVQILAVPAGMKRWNVQPPAVTEAALGVLVGILLNRAKPDFPFAQVESGPRDHCATNTLLCLRYLAMDPQGIASFSTLTTADKGGLISSLRKMMVVQSDVKAAQSASGVMQKLVAYSEEPAWASLGVMQGALDFPLAQAANQEPLANQDPHKAERIAKAEALERKQEQIRQAAQTRPLPSGLRLHM